MSGRGADLQDQVPRKLRYQLLHPGVMLSPPCEHDPMWRARLDDGKETEVKAIHLSELLDELERLDQLDQAG